MFRLLVALIILFSSCVSAHEAYDLNKVSPLLIKLSEQEDKAIKGKVFKVAITDYPPFIYFDVSKNKFDGIAFDTLNIISKKIGAKFEYVEYANLKDVHDAVRDGHADISFLSDFSQSALAKSNTFFTKKAHIIVARKNKNSWTDMFLEANENSKLSMATVRGSAFARLAKNLKVDIKIIEVNTQIEALIRVAIGETDFTLADLSTFGYYQQKISTNSLVVADSSHIFEVSSVFGFNQKIDKAVISAINKGIDSIDKKESAVIESHWNEYLYKEPIMRFEFVLLLGTLLLFVVMNVLWYYAMIHNLQRQEVRLTEKWISALSEAIENERTLMMATMKKHENDSKKESKNATL